MKKVAGKLLALVLAAAVVFTIITISACAKDGKASKANKKMQAAAPKTTVVPANVSAVPLELAKEIALNHAGADGSSTIFTREKLDKAVYELKFSDQNGKYEYKISANDGTILDYKWESRTPAGPAPTTPANTPAGEGTISREQAGQIALDAAEVDGETLKYLVCYVSWINHVPTAYEVKFATRWAEYHYTIDLDTGAVLGGVCYPHHQQKH